MANANCGISFVSEHSDEAEIYKKQETIWWPDIAFQMTTHQNRVQTPLSLTKIENEASHKNSKYISWQ